MAPIYLGAVLDREALDDGLAHAACPNDLLPRRPFDRLPQNVAGRLVDWVDHSLLGLVTSTHLEMPRKYGQAVESLLTALMHIDRGLPQGVQASDLFATAFLLPSPRCGGCRRR